jgi:hypothetical protein
LICKLINDFKNDGEESVSQHQVVNKLVQELELNENNGTTIERSVETTKKINNVIQHLITKENVLMITQDAKVKSERLLCMNINFDLDTMNKQ